MGLCLSATNSSSSSPWPDLPPELAGVILARLLSQADRLTFSDACHDWRLAAQHQRTLMPPAMPWINLGRGLYHDLAADGNGMAWRRLATPKGCHAGASFGGLLMYEHKRSHRCFLRDPFSRATPAIELPFINIRYWADAVADTNPLTTWHGPFYDLLVCSSHLHIAIYLHSKGLSSITCLGPGITKTTHKLSCSTAGHQNHALDLIYKSIAFHHGKIFAVNSTENLFVHEFVAGGIRVEHVIKEGPIGAANYDNHYLVRSADQKKLLMVRWRHPPKPDWLQVDHRTIDLQVFEADLENGEWSSEVKDMGNQVIFVGRTGSRALVAACSTYRRLQGNRVFLLGYELASSRCLAANVMISRKASRVYLSGGPSRAKYPLSSWFFPSQ